MADNTNLQTIITALQIIIAAGSVYRLCAIALEIMVDRDSFKVNMKRATKVLGFFVLSMVIVTLIPTLLSYF